MQLNRIYKASHIYSAYLLTCTYVNVIVTFISSAVSQNTRYHFIIQHLSGQLIYNICDNVKF